MLLCRMMAVAFAATVPPQSASGQGMPLLPRAYDVPLAPAAEILRVVHAPEVVLIHDAGRLIRLDPRTGRSHWSIDFERRIRWAGRHDDLLLLGTDFQLFGLHLDSGTYAWNAGYVPDLSDSPYIDPEILRRTLGWALDGGYVCTVEQRGWVTAYDAATGRRRWHRQLPYVLTGLVAIREDRLFVAVRDGRRAGLLTFDIDRGEPLDEMWRSDDRQIDWLRLPPGDDVLIGGPDWIGRYTRTQRPAWERIVPGLFRAEGRAVLDGRIVGLTVDGVLTGYAIDDGRPAWRQKLPEDPETLAAWYSEAALFVSAGGEVGRLDPADGEMLWSRPLGTGAVRSVRTAGRDVLVLQAEPPGEGHTTGRLLRLNPADGAVRAGSGRLEGPVDLYVAEEVALVRTRGGLTGIVLAPDAGQATRPGELTPATRASTLSSH